MSICVQWQWATSTSSSTVQYFIFKFSHCAHNKYTGPAWEWGSSRSSITTFDSLQAPDWAVLSCSRFCFLLVCWFSIIKKLVVLPTRIIMHSALYGLMYCTVLHIIDVNNLTCLGRMLTCSNVSQSMSNVRLVPDLSISL